MSDNLSDRKKILIKLGSKNEKEVDFLRTEDYVMRAKIIKLHAKTSFLRVKYTFCNLKNCSFSIYQ